MTICCGLFFFIKEFRERDGIPDLRRSARFRYASVTLPKVGQHSTNGLLLYIVIEERFTRKDKVTFC